MTREIVWKEFRDQGAVLTALLVMGCGLLLATAVLSDSSAPGRANELSSLVAASRLALVMLALTAGVVVGGTLFAGEREAGTYTFLDRMPGSRWAVWWRKVLTGSVMVTVAAGVFLGVGIALGVLGSGRTLPGWIAMVLVVSAVGFGWGVFGSVFARTSLSACATGLLTGATVAVGVYVVTALAITLARSVFGLRWSFAGTMWETVTIVTLYSVLAVPVPLAGWFFTAADRQRFLPAISTPSHGVRGIVSAGLRLFDLSRWSLALGRLLWLSHRQVLVPSAVLVGGALAAGGVFVPVELSPMLTWPFVSLVAGVLAAVAVMADEQGSDAARFWGERRISLWRFWGMKLVVSTVLTLVMLVALLIPPLIAVSVTGAKGPFVASLFRSILPLDMRAILFLYLLSWPAFGIVFGHLSTILFRKAIVSVAVGVMSAGIFASVWLPSLLAGGLHTWQVFGPVAMVLVTSRAILWAWSTDRLGTRPTLTRLGAGLSAVVMMTIAGLCYRVAEVPVVAEVEDDLRFAAALPTFDEQQSGRDVRRAVSQFNEIGAAVRTAKADLPATPSRSQPPPYTEYTLAVLADRWPVDDAAWIAWLDAMHSTDWPATLAAAARKPVGVFVDPNELHVRSLLPQLNDIRSMSGVYLAGGLLQQTQGDPVAFLDRLETWLFVCRCLRNDTLTVSVNVSWWCEQDALNAIDRSLEHLGGRPDLFRRALAIVQAHDHADPFDARSTRLAQQTVVRNAVLASGQWLPRFLQEAKPGGYHDETLGQVDEASSAEANVIGVAWAFPWEQERLRRVVGLGNVPGMTDEQQEYLRGAPGWDTILWERTIWRRGGLDVGQSDILARRRATVIKLALRLYQHEKGTLPDRLDRLVPIYLPEVPEDPFDKNPFHYRVSVGEKLEMGDRNQDPYRGLPPGFAPEGLTAGEFHAVAGLVGGSACWPLAPEWWNEPTDDESRLQLPLGEAVTPNTSDREIVTVPQGQGILWSSGPDRRNDGGTRLRLPSQMWSQQQPEDLIFLVPKPPGARPNMRPTR